MIEFITQGIISGQFTDDKKIHLATNYLAKDVITQDDVLFVLKSIYPSEFTEDGEEVEHDALRATYEQVLADAKKPKELEVLQQTVDSIFTDVLPNLFN